jgi:hypothetical protein
MTSHGGMLAMVASGRLKPARPVGATVAVCEVNRVLTPMTGFQARGFQVINNWRAAAACTPS